MNLGDLVLFQGRRYYLRGLDPTGVLDGHAFLEDAETGQEIVAPLDEVELAEAGEASEPV